MAAAAFKEVRPPVLGSNSQPPAIFDGTTKLYMSYVCPYAQRTWITRNYKGLQGQIKLIPLDLFDRPAWYKEKVYPENKMPSLEHKNQVRGESMDLVRLIESEFEGPSILPSDHEKKQFAEELISYCDSFNKVNFAACTSSEDVATQVGSFHDKIEEALSRYSEGPFFLGDFSIVDITYAPFIERFYLFFSEMKNYDITEGRPNLSKWIEEMNKLEAYTQTKLEPQDLLAVLKRKFGIN